MMVVEIVAGLAFSSMALLADGLHMGSHTVALGIAALAYVYVRRHAHDRRYSFGTGKVNALGGFTGAVLLASFAAIMAAGSIDRFINPATIEFDYAILVADDGLAVNGVCVAILNVRDHAHVDGDDHAHHDHNLRAAYLHVLADALTSVLAIVALLAAKYLGLTWMDPLMGIVGALLVDVRRSASCAPPAARCSTGRGRRSCGERVVRWSRTATTAASPTCTSGRSPPASTPLSWSSYPPRHSPRTPTRRGCRTASGSAT